MASRCLGIPPVAQMANNHYCRVMSKDLLARITIRPEQCHGRPCIRGMRILVVDVLEMLARGATEAELLTDFPDLEADDIRACLAYAVTQLGHPVIVDSVLMPSCRPRPHKGSASVGMKPPR